MNTNAKKSKYGAYGNIYSEQCVNCIKEGTYHCRLEIIENKCKNFEKYTKEGILQFGGY